MVISSYIHPPSRAKNLCKRGGETFPIKNWPIWTCRLLWLSVQRFPSHVQLMFIITISAIKTHPDAVFVNLLRSPGYVGWGNRFRGINSWAPWMFTNTGLESLVHFCVAKLPIQNQSGRTDIGNSPRMRRTYTVLYIVSVRVRWSGRYVTSPVSILSPTNETTRYTPLLI